MVVEADRPSYFPIAIFVLPERDELRLTDIIRFSGMMEAMNTNLDRAITGNWINLERPGYKFTRYFPANIVLDAVDEGLTPTSQAGFIVIELQVIRNHGGKSSQIAMIIGIKKLRIQRLNFHEQRIGSVPGLGMGHRRAGCIQGHYEERGEKKRFFHWFGKNSWLECNQSVLRIRKGNRSASAVTTRAGLTVA